MVTGGDVKENTFYTMRQYLPLPYVETEMVVQTEILPGRAEKTPLITDSEKWWQEKKEFTRRKRHSKQGER